MYCQALATRAQTPAKRTARRPLHVLKRLQHALPGTRYTSSSTCTKSCHMSSTRDQTPAQSPARRPLHVLKTPAQSPARRPLHAFKRLHNVLPYVLYTCSNACTKSCHMSSMPSMPQLKRTRLSRMPICARASGPCGRGFRVSAARAEASDLRVRLGALLQGF